MPSILKTNPDNINTVLDRHDFILNNLTIAQIVLVCVAISIGFILKKFFDCRISHFIHNENTKSRFRFRRTLARHFSYLSTPLYGSITLLLLSTLFIAVGIESKIIHLVNEFFIIWFILRLITVLSGSTSPKPVVIIIGTILFLDIFDLMDKTIASLEKASLHLGSIHISALLVVKIIIITIICLWIISLISKVSSRFVSNFKHLNKSAKNITSTLIDTILYFALFMVILKVIGVDVTTVAVIGSAIGIGIGFGLQKITSNFIAGLILLFEGSIKEGDVIELPGSPDDMGFVKHSGIRYTLIRTFDNKEIMVPNEDFITNKVVNWTFSDREVRIKINIGVSYKSDVHLVRKILLEAAQETHDEGVIHQPVCVMSGYGDSSVDFFLFVWVNDVDKVQHSKRSEVLIAVWDKFKEHNIEIPFPQRDVHIKENVTNLTS